MVPIKNNIKKQKRKKIIQSRERESRKGNKQEHTKSERKIEKKNKRKHIFKILEWRNLEKRMKKKTEWCIGIVCTINGIFAIFASIAIIKVPY